MNRRDLLIATLGTVCGAAAGSGRPSGEPHEVDLSALKAAQEILGLTFEDGELEQILQEVREQPQRFAQLRAAALQNQEAPATVFRVMLDRKGGPSGQSPRLPNETAEVQKAPSDWDFQPVHVLSRWLRDRVVSSRELTERCLHRLREADARLHCVVSLLEDSARAQAAQADEEMARGRWRGPLHGVPYGLKDLFAVKGTRTTWGAKPLAEQTIDVDCAVYEQLRRAGAVLCAKLTLGALAMGDVWFGGRTRNPWNPEQGSSGSSAGSAAAVSAGLVPFAIGTETLGSIVSPSTRCGVSGLRPTFGRISRFGAMSLCWSLDKVGPLARDVRDLGLVCDALVGADPRDPSSVSAPFLVDFERPLASWRIGVDRSLFARGPDLSALEALEGAGARFTDVKVPSDGAALVYPILGVEAAAAFDEMTRNGTVRSLTEQGPNAWPAVFRRARFHSAVEWVQADRVRRRLCDRWNRLFEDVDVLFTPSFRGQVLVSTNFTGHPTVVVPSGLGNRGNAPTSVSFVAGTLDEGAALAVAHHYQQITDWHRRRPPGF